MALLLVVNEGFDDMSFLSCQVILEENNYDVIISSKNNEALKGETSSVMTVSLEEALQQNLEYEGMILVGGKDLGGWETLNSTIKDFNSKGKPIGLIAEGVDIFSFLFNSVQLSSNGEIIQDGKILSMKNPEEPENFIEKFLTLLK